MTVNTYSHRAVYNSVPWPTWNILLAPDVTVFMPVSHQSLGVYDNDNGQQQEIHNNLPAPALVPPILPTPSLPSMPSTSNDRASDSEHDTSDERTRLVGNSSEHPNGDDFNVRRGNAPMATEITPRYSGSTNARTQYHSLGMMEPLENMQAVGGDNVVETKDADLRKREIALQARNARLRYLGMANNRSNSNNMSENNNSLSDDVDIEMGSRDV